MQWPERFFHCHSSVTSLDFSANNPGQLAVGMLDGTIAIYNVMTWNSMACITNSRWGLSLFVCLCVYMLTVWHGNTSYYWIKRFFLLYFVMFLFCSDCSNKHLHPVWQVTWTKQEMASSGEDKAEALVSVSADGRISKWFLCSNRLDSQGTVVWLRCQQRDYNLTHTMIK